MTPTELRAVLLERLPADPKWVAWVEGVVERVGTVEDPRIARIAALPVHRIDPDALGWISAEQVTAVLGEVQPTPPHRIDREALHVVDVHIDALRELAQSPAGAAMPQRMEGALSALRDVRESLAARLEASS